MHALVCGSDSIVYCRVKKELLTAFTMGPVRNDPEKWGDKRGPIIWMFHKLPEIKFCLLKVLISPFHPIYHLYTCAFSRARKREGQPFLNLVHRRTEVVLKLALPHRSCIVQIIHNWQSSLQVVIAKAFVIPASHLQRHSCIFGSTQTGRINRYTPLTYMTAGDARHNTGLSTHPYLK